MCASQKKRPILSFERKVVFLHFVFGMNYPHVSIGNVLNHAD